MRRDPWQALADPTRRRIIEILSNGSLTVNEIAAHFTISRPAISKQIKILNESELLDVLPHGRERTCHLTLQGLEEVHKWIIQYERFWIQKLDELNRYLDDQSKEDQKSD